jgi:hypothetical protein
VKLNQMFYRSIIKVSRNEKTVLGYSPVQLTAKRQGRAREMGPFSTRKFAAVTGYCDKNYICTF